MKNLLLAITLLVFNSGIISCSRERDIDILSGERTEVKFSSNIITIGTHPKASGAIWDPNDAIGIYMYEENDVNVVEDKSNIKYVSELGGKTGDFENAGTVIYFPDNGDKVRFMAYYPYNTDISDDVYNVNVVTQSSQQDIDLLYSFDKNAKYDKAVTDNKIPLVFDHQLTKIYVNVKAGDGLVDDDLQNISVSFLNFNTKADFNLISGSLSNQSTPAEIVASSFNIKDGYVASFEAIVLPVETIPNAQIKFDLKNGNVETGVESNTYIWNFDEALAKSTKYTYNVTINRSGIVVVATVNDWINTEENEVVAE